MDKFDTAMTTASDNEIAPTGNEKALHKDLSMNDDWMQDELEGGRPTMEKNTLKPDAQAWYPTGYGIYKHYSSKAVNPNDIEDDEEKEGSKNLSVRRQRSSGTSRDNINAPVGTKAKVVATDARTLGHQVADDDQRSMAFDSIKKD